MASWLSPRLYHEMERNGKAKRPLSPRRTLYGHADPHVSAIAVDDGAHLGGARITRGGGKLSRTDTDVSSGLALQAIKLPQESKNATSSRDRRTAGLNPSPV
jgi:hypothetical protein